ncbi:hypothetical protein [Ammoniphilus sp. 3BR4]|uniref:hypothetical protein n=1 Tax=Ammoniphilus sp. 3BR4 TaxID=3158265 RepID=UPI0034657FB6
MKRLVLSDELIESLAFDFCNEHPEKVTFEQFLEREILRMKQVIAPRPLREMAER